MDITLGKIEDLGIRTICFDGVPCYYCWQDMVKTLTQDKEIILGFVFGMLSIAKENQITSIDKDSTDNSFNLELQYGFKETEFNLEKHSRIYFVSLDCITFTLSLISLAFQHDREGGQTASAVIKPIYDYINSNLLVDTADKNAELIPGII